MHVLRQPRRGERDQRPPGPGEKRAESLGNASPSWARRMTGFVHTANSELFAGGLSLVKEEGLFQSESLLGTNVNKQLVHDVGLLDTCRAAESQLWVGQLRDGYQPTGH